MIEKFSRYSGLISYGNDIVESFCLLASQIADIFGGVKPQDIPFYQVMKFELVSSTETFASDAHLLLLFDLRGIELHVDARRGRNLEQALHRLQRILQEVLIHVVPL